MVVIAMVSLGAGCQRSEPPAPRLAVLTGEVIWREAQSPELRIRISSDRAAERVLQCEFSKNSEIFINDRFARLDEALVGDEVEVRGRYIDTRITPHEEERFAVETMLIRRVAAPAPLPAPAAALLDANAPTGTAADGGQAPPANAPPELQAPTAPVDQTDNREDGRRGLRQSDAQDQEPTAWPLNR